MTQYDCKKKKSCHGGFFLYRHICTAETMLDATREIYIVAPCHKMPTRAKQASNEVHKKKRNIFSLKKKLKLFLYFALKL